MPQCQGTTLHGTRCKRKIEGFCTQHSQDGNYPVKRKRVLYLDSIFEKQTPASFPDTIDAQLEALEDRTRIFVYGSIKRPTLQLRPPGETFFEKHVARLQRAHPTETNIHYEFRIDAFEWYLNTRMFTRGDTSTEDMFYDKNNWTILLGGIAERWNTLANRIQQNLIRVITRMGKYHRIFANFRIQNDFVSDAQNVHRVETVKYVMDTIASLDPPHPSQNTIGEIFMNCALSSSAAKQMTHMYFTEMIIYYIPDGYRTVLDKVWAFVRDHPDTDYLKTRVSHELEDNVGTCPDGNLSRLCNILLGFKRGFVSTRETLQDEMAKASTHPSESDRIAAGLCVLKDLRIPEIEWSVWLDALRENG